MLILGNIITELETVNSTNSYLLEKSKNNTCYEGEVVIAHHQSAGRGQRGSNWESLPGENLMCSIYLTPVFLTGETSFLLSKAIAIALYRVVSNTCRGKEVKIKWPNDIYVGGKKIAGILIENQFKGKWIKQTVIGVGLNVNQTEFLTVETATSIALQQGKQYNVKEMLTLVLQEFESLYLSLKQGESNLLQEEYNTNLMNYNRYALYKNTVTQKMFKAKITQVQNNGILTMKHVDGTQEHFQFKEIELLL